MLVESMLNSQQYPKFKTGTRIVCLFLCALLSFAYILNLLHFDVLIANSGYPVYRNVQYLYARAMPISQRKTLERLEHLSPLARQLDEKNWLVAREKPLPLENFNHQHPVPESSRAPLFGKHASFELGILTQTNRFLNFNQKSSAELAKNWLKPENFVVLTYSLIPPLHNFPKPHALKLPFPTPPPRV